MALIKMPRDSFSNLYFIVIVAYINNFKIVNIITELYFHY